MKMLALCLALALAGCSKSEPAQPPPGPTAAKPSKDPATARKLIGEGAVVIDVRTPEEFAEGHVASAVNIPVDDFAARIAEVDKLVAGDKARPVVVYCGSGSRSARAKKQLDASGYSHVVNGGGFDDLQ